MTPVTGSDRVHVVVDELPELPPVPGPPVPEPKKVGDVKYLVSVLGVVALIAAVICGLVIIDSVDSASDGDEIAWSLALDVFGVGLIAAAFICALIWIIVGRSPAAGVTQLPAATWKLSDSWLTSLTVGGSLIVALAGSTDLFSALFEETKTRNAIVLSSLMAAGTTGVAGLVAGLDTTEDTSHTRILTFGGLLASVFFVATAAFSQLWLIIVLADADTTDAPPEARKVVTALTIVAALIIGAYCVITTRTVAKHPGKLGTQSRLL